MPVTDRESALPRCCESLASAVGGQRTARFILQCTPGRGHHCCPERNCQLEPNQEVSSGHPAKAPLLHHQPPPFTPCPLHESTLKTVPTRYTVPPVSLARGVQLEQVAERTDVSDLWDTARASFSRPPTIWTHPAKMDSQLVNQLFKQLFRHHPACQSQKHLRQLATATAHNGHRVQQHHSRQQRRPYSSQRRGASSPVGDESQWQQRTKILNQDMTEEYKRAPMVTAAELWGRKQRPRRVKMLLRDFIEGWLPVPDSMAHYPRG